MSAGATNHAVHTKDGVGFLQIENQTAVLGDGGRSANEANLFMNVELAK